jgi:hypothetical protein
VRRRVLVLVVVAIVVVPVFWLLVFNTGHGSGRTQTTPMFRGVFRQHLR